MAGINLMGELGGGKKSSGFSSRSFSKKPKVKISSFNLDLDKRRLAQFLFVLLFILLGKIGLEFYLKQQVVKTQRAVNQVVTQIQNEKSKASSLKGISEEMDSYEKQVQELQEKLKKLKQVSLNRNVLVQMIDFAITEMPQDVWLKSLNTNRDKGEIHVEGYSSTPQLVSRFLKKLEGSVFFPKWELQYMEDVTLTEAPSGASITVPPHSKKFVMKARIEEPR